MEFKASWEDTNETNVNTQKFVLSTLEIAGQDNAQWEPSRWYLQGG